MKKIAIIISTTVLILSGCKNRPANPIELPSDHATEEFSSDVDGNFHDFIYQFIFNKEFQLLRNITGLNMPKLYYQTFDGFFLHFFNSFNIPDKEFSIDLTNERYLSILKPIEHKKTTLTFKKIDGSWFLAEIKDIEFDFYNVENFEAFLYQFSTDSVFRNGHIKFPLKYGYLDDDYEKSTNYYTEENVPQYDFFNSSNLMFFHSREIGNEKQILIFLRGIDNGINSYYYFEKFNDTWRLIKDNDYSM